MENFSSQDKPLVLVADDMRDTADVYCLLLSSAGYRVSRAYDGLTALSLAKVTKPDAAVLNYRMPGLSGLQVLAELREAGVQTKVILTSGTCDFNELAFRSSSRVGRAGLRLAGRLAVSIGVKSPRGRRRRVPASPLRGSRSRAPAAFASGARSRSAS
jgi:CheY-like chemotaxis protein